MLNSIQFDITLILYLTLFLCFYFSVAFIFYKTMQSEIKIMQIIRDPKTAARNRKKIDHSISITEKEIRMVALWPLFVIRGLVDHVKKKNSKKE